MERKNSIPKKAQLNRQEKPIKKTIQLITSYPLHNEPVIRNRLIPFIKIALKNGYAVQVVSPDDKFFVKKNLNFDHKLTPDKNEKPRNFLLRALFENSQARRILKSAKKEHATIRMITIPSMFLLFNIYLLKNNKFITDLRDATWEYIPEKKYISRMAKRHFRKLANKNINKSEIINVTNSAEKRYLQEKFNIKDQAPLIISNGVSKDQFRQLSNIKTYNTKPTIAYIGNIGIAQNLRNLIDAAIETPSIDYIIAGEGTDFYAIKKYAKELNLRNVRITGRIGWDKVIEIYKESNILYAQLSPEFSMAMPSKLYEYLSTGKFVLYGGSQQAKSMLSEFDHNMVINPCNTPELVSAINQINKNQSFLHSSARNISNIKKSFIRENSIQKMFDFLRDNQ